MPDPFVYRGARVTINNVEQPEGTAEFVTTPPAFDSVSLWPSDVVVGGSLTMNVDAATYDRILALTTAPAVTFEMTREYGEHDPFHDRPQGWREVLRQMRRIISYEWRKAQGRVTPHTTERLIVPNVAYALSQEDRGAR